MNLSKYGLLPLAKSYRQQNSNFLTILESMTNMRDFKVVFSNKRGCNFF